MNIRNTKRIFFVILSFLMVFALVGCVVVTISFGDSDRRPSSSNSSVNTADFSKLTYAAFGDSITYGHTSSGQMTDHYPKLVGETLGFKSYVNRGTSGGTFCANDLNRRCVTDDIISCTTKYDVISVLLGVNDCMVSLPLGTLSDNTNETIFGALNLIAEKFTTFYADSFCFFMTPLKYKGFETENSAGYKLADVRMAIIQVAMMNDIPYLDLYTYGNFESVMYSSGSDGLHPDQTFVKEQMAPQIADFIKKNYK